MKTPMKLVAVVFVLVLAACASDRERAQLISKSDYSGTGDLMARCMQYASQSYCEHEIWGGGER